MMQPIKSPFRWCENRQPSIFAADPHFTRRTSVPVPKAANQIVIAAPAQADRTNSIKGAK